MESVARAPRTCAVPLLCSQSKPAVAATLETPDGVPAIPVSAETLEHFALVHICRRISGVIKTERRQR